MLSSTIVVLLTLLVLSACLLLLLSSNNLRARSTSHEEGRIWLEIFSLVKSAGYEYEDAKIKQLTIYFMVVVAMFGFMYSPVGIIICCSGAAVGGYLMLTFKAKTYAVESLKINDELCYSIARRLRSGESLIDALRSVQSQFNNSKLLSHVNRYVENGYSLEKAIVKTTNDTNIVSNESEKMLCGTIALAHKMGGNSARIFERIGDCFHHTYELSSDTKAALSQVKMSAWVISLLPVGFLCMSSLMGLGGTTFLFTTPLGWVFLFFGLIMQLVGVLWMKRMVHKGVGLWSS